MPECNQNLRGIPFQLGQLHVTTEHGNTAIRVPRLEQYNLITVELG